MEFLKKTLREVHQAIRDTHNAAEAAHLLGVERVVLSQHLVGRRCNKFGLSYTALKALPLGEEAIKIFTTKKYNVSLDHLHNLKNVPLQQEKTLLLMTSILRGIIHCWLLVDFFQMAAEVIRIAPFRKFMPNVSDSRKKPFC